MGVNVLSLFDGMSCGRIALERAGIEVDNYFSSEVDKYAIKIADKNYPQDTSNRLGDVRNIDTSKLPSIDLLIGGSPCQSFSFAGKQKGMSTKEDIEILTLEHYLELKEKNFEFQGQSYLFWEYMRILTELRKVNPNIKFMLENVKMSKKWEEVLNTAIEVKPILINSASVSAQNRQRLYWTNIENIIQPKDKGILLEDIVEEGIPCLLVKQGKVLEKINPPKSATLLARDYKGFGNQGMTGVVLNNILSLEENSKVPHTKSGLEKLKEAQDGIIATQLTSSKNFGNAINVKGKAFTLRTSTSNGLIYKEAPYYFYRALTPTESEALQTVPRNYTEGVSNTQRYKMLGNGWTVDVIAHIFKGLKEQYE